MENQAFVKNEDADIWERKEQLVEKGRQLHNQAIQQMFIMAFRGCAGYLEKRFSGSAKDHDFDYFCGEIPAKK